MNDLHDVVLEMLPSLALTKRRDLPACPGIYFALSSKGTILYIGQTRNLYNRWAQHNRMKQLADHGCVSIAWYACSPDQLQDLECQLIEQFQPLLNGAKDTSVSHERIGVYIDRKVWHAFRIACVTRQMSSSKVLEQFIAQQLATWQREAQKETNHA